ncbi:MAG: glucose transporter [Bradyrhizobium sp.]
MGTSSQTFCTRVHVTLALALLLACAANMALVCVFL